MARKVFFSFHYQRDIFRVNIIRNAWIVKGVQETGYWDRSIWESKRTQGRGALEKLIKDGLDGTSVTAVLIGQETWLRPWVKYEIHESRRRGNGLLGIRIHNVKSAPLSLGSLGSLSGLGLATDQPGLNPFAYHRKSGAPKDVVADFLNPKLASLLELLDPTIENLVPVYDWVQQNGYNNIGDWAEAAAGRGLLTKLPAGAK